MANRGYVRELTNISPTYQTLQEGVNKNWDERGAITTNFVEMEIGLAPFIPMTKQFVLREKSIGPDSSMVMPESDTGASSTPPWQGWVNAGKNVSGRKPTYSQIAEGNLEPTETMRIGQNLSGLQTSATMAGTLLRESAISGWRRRSQASFGAIGEVVTENIARDIFHEMKLRDADFAASVEEDRFNLLPEDPANFGQDVLLNEGLDFGVKTQTERIKQHAVYYALQKQGVPLATLQQTMGGEETISGVTGSRRGKSGKVLQQIFIEKPGSMQEAFEASANEYVTDMNVAVNKMRSKLKTMGLRIDDVRDLLTMGARGKGTGTGTAMSLITGFIPPEMEKAAKKVGRQVGQSLLRSARTVGNPYYDASPDIQSAFSPANLKEFNRFLRRSVDTPVLQSLATAFSGKNIMMEQIPLSSKVLKAGGEKEGAQNAQGFAFIEIVGSQNLATLQFRLAHAHVSEQQIGEEKSYGMDVWLIEQYSNLNWLGQSATQTLKNHYFPLLQREKLAEDNSADNMVSFFDYTTGEGSIVQMGVAVAQLMTEREIAESLMGQMTDNVGVGQVAGKVAAIYNEIIKAAGEVSETWRSASSRLTGWKGDIDRFNYSEDPDSGLQYQAGVWFPNNYWVNDTGFGFAISPFMGVARGNQTNSQIFYNRFKASVDAAT